jgi:hypothetical protein
MRFEESGEMPANEWATQWLPTDGDGAPIPPDKLPLSIAVAERPNFESRPRDMSIEVPEFVPGR